MSFLATFPRLLSVSILSEFLDVEDLSRLEVSLSNNFFQQLYLNVIQSSEFLANGDISISRNEFDFNSYAYWLGSRRLQIKNLYLDFDFLTSENTAYLNLLRVDSIYYKNYKTQAQVINENSILKILRFGRSVPSTAASREVLHALLLKCPKLRMVDFGGYKQENNESDTKDILSKIAASCPRLQILRSVDKPNRFDVLLSPLHVHAPSLHYVVLGR